MLIATLAARISTAFAGSFTLAPSRADGRGWRRKEGEAEYDAECEAEVAAQIAAQIEVDAARGLAIAPVC